MKKAGFKKLFALLLAMVMVFALPTEASASKKVTASAAWKKAKAVKTGKTTVTSKQSSGSYFNYVKFTAKKTKTYKITISNLHKPGSSSSKDIINGSVALKKKNKYGYLESMTLKQNKTKVTTLYVCSARSHALNTGKTTAYTHVKSRTVSVKLKKGQTIYISFGFAADSGKKCCYDLKIK